MIVVVFDFDDTLFPTTYTMQTKNRIPHTELAEHILDIVSMIGVYAHKFYIITNADRGWVKLCVENFLPGCENLLEKMEVISTVSDGFSTHEDMKEWKISAFTERLSTHFQDGEIHQLICFGDAEHDRLAAIHMKDMFSNILVKNIKFWTEPEPDFLIEQHKAIKKVIDMVIFHEDHVDIMINMEDINKDV